MVKRFQMWRCVVYVHPPRTESILILSTYSKGPLTHEKLGDCGSQRVLWVQTRLGLDPSSGTVWLDNPGHVFFPLCSNISSYGEGCAHLPGPWWLDELRSMRCLAVAGAQWGQSSWEYHCYCFSGVQRSWLHMPAEESGWYCGLGELGGSGL